MAEKLKLRTDTDGSFQHALNQTLDTSGWFESPVVAACMVRQGQSPSMLGAITGAGLVNVLKPRAAKEMPRSFVLAGGREIPVSVPASRAEDAFAALLSALA